MYKRCFNLRAFVCSRLNGGLDCLTESRYHFGGQECGSLIARVMVFVHNEARISEEAKLEYLLYVKCRIYGSIVPPLVPDYEQWLPILSSLKSVLINSRLLLYVPR